MHSSRILPGAALGLIALACCGAAGAKSLYPTQFFATLNTPNAVVSGDVNGDSHPDLIEIGIDQTIAVLINNGDGTFKSPTHYYVVGNQPHALATGDFNGDGKLDIAVINSTDNTVSIMLGNGDGTFKAPTAAEVAAKTGTPAPSYATGQDPLSLVVADMNGDGIPDIVTANFADDTLSVLIGNGDGTFKPQIALVTGVGPIFVTAADLNNDGKLDLLVNNNLDDTLGVLLNAGKGLFRTMTATKLGPRLVNSYFQMMVVGDFAHDGKLGVITTTTSLDGDTVIYLPGKGDGGFGPAHAFVTGLQTAYLATADVDGDGLPDLIAGSAANNTIRVMFGNNDGGFSSGLNYSASGIGSGNSVQRFAVADFSGTGKPDIAAVNTSGSFMQLLYNDGTGHFHLKNSYATGATPSDVETADLNGDGHLDLVETNTADGTLGVRLGNGDGTFQAMQTYQVGQNPQRLLLVDVNHDGKLDAVTVNFGDNTVSVLLGNGDGTFRAARSFNAGPNAVDLAAGDMDDDGKLDLLVANSVVNTVSILHGNGDGTFDAPVSYDVGVLVDGLAVGDLEHSGFPDVVTVGNRVAVLHNDHKGGLKTPTVDASTGLSDDLYFAVGARVTLADVDHDGQADMLIADYSNSQLVVLQGLGKGFFNTTPADFPSCSNPHSLAVADLNADGNKDVVVSCSGSSAAGVMLGNGHGAFLITPYPAEIEPRGVAIGDFNEDGQPDLAVVNGGSDDMNVLLETPGVVAADQAPRAASSSLAIPNGQVPANGGFLALDPDGDPLSFVAVVLPTKGSFSYSTGDGSFTYQANTGEVGSDSVSFQVSDGIKLSGIATVSIDIESNPTGSHHHGLGAFWLPWLPVLGLFAALRRRRRS